MTEPRLVTDAEAEAYVALTATQPQPNVISRLLATRTALMAEVGAQWLCNHDEHCSQEWPHSDGKRCYWPPPALLAELHGDSTSGTSAPPETEQP